MCFAASTETHTTSGECYCTIALPSSQVYWEIGSNSEVYCEISSNSEIYWEISSNSEIYCEISSNSEVYCEISSLTLRHTR